MKELIVIENNLINFNLNYLKTKFKLREVKSDNVLSSTSATNLELKLLEKCFMQENCVLYSIYNFSNNEYFLSLRIMNKIGHIKELVKVDLSQTVPKSRVIPHNIISEIEKFISNEINLNKYIIFTENNCLDKYKDRLDKTNITLVNYDNFYSDKYKRVLLNLFKSNQQIFSITKNSKYLNNLNTGDKYSINIEDIRTILDCLNEANKINYHHQVPVIKENTKSVSQIKYRSIKVEKTFNINNYIGNYNRQLRILIFGNSVRLNRFNRSIGLYDLPNVNIMFMGNKKYDDIIKGFRTTIFNNTDFLIIRYSVNNGYILESLHGDIILKRKSFYGTVDMDKLYSDIVKVISTLRFTESWINKYYNK